MKKETCGIYVISERATQRAIYVGQSIGIEGRWPRHWKRFPKDHFDYRIIQECLPAELNFWEKYYIRALKTHWTEAGENQNWGGQHWRRPEEPLSPATRAKLSASQSAAQKGRTISKEHRAKISATLKGRVQPEETKAKHRGRVPPNKGKPMSEEQKAKLRGKVLTAEQRAKQSAALKGRVPHNKGVPMSEEAKAKQSAALKGRVAPNKGVPMSEEAKAKSSAAAKARAALKRAAKAAAEAALEALLFAETETILPPE